MKSIYVKTKIPHNWFSFNIDIRYTLGKCSHKGILLIYVMGTTQELSSVMSFWKLTWQTWTKYPLDSSGFNGFHLYWEYHPPSHLTKVLFPCKTLSPSETFHQLPFLCTRSFCPICECVTHLHFYNLHLWCSKLNRKTKSSGCNRCIVPAPS